MKAKQVVITEKGSWNSIKVREFEVKEPGENEVLIQVEYGGLAFADVMMRKMSMPGMPKMPFVPGADLGGVVERVGSAVKDLKKGDRVVSLLMSDFGGQSQYVTINADRVKRVPDSIPLEKATCMVVNYLTALRLLNLAA